ncbi:MAG: ABC transporter ATP-binding protein [Desulfosarcina sp.]|nr:ABC transporter ATP-binding protein [Desulfosarcina sp.]MBC2743445.1 ABC transporter ATP-binding protein [Desulfosarcina sp.]MBC2766355.1 ABC transporter ATP-binding protein [Desulfosarcina sp.]
MRPLLSIETLSVEFTNYQGTSSVLDRVSLTIQKGEILGLVGESGCGKSVTARTILRLIPEPPGRVTSGAIHFGGEDLLTVSNKRMQKVRGNEISMIFQEPMSSLNPVFTVGNQMREVVRLHRDLKRREADALCTDMLHQVQMPDPDEVLRKYPHELSGGMRQRVMIAMALTSDPKLLIADEPTTALDVTVQGQVLAILTDLSRQRNISVLMITHDMGVVAQICDRVAVMYAGRVVEMASVGELFANPIHPYTQGLIASIPNMDDSQHDGQAPSRFQTLYSIPGTVPTLIQPPPGCRFHPRCEEVGISCDREVPELCWMSPDHAVACHTRMGGHS